LKNCHFLCKMSYVEIFGISVYVVGKALPTLAYLK
jgi:hypothetical protein